MDFLLHAAPAQAAAIELGLLVVVMLGIKLYVGGQRGKLKVPSGETTPEFSRVTRVQLNAVEDVPVLMAGILGLGVLSMPAWYIHMCGLVLVVSRLLHAFGLSRSSGFSYGRFIGTVGTMLVHLAVAGALLVHGFAG